VSRASGIYFPWIGLKGLALMGFHIISLIGGIFMHGPLGFSFSDFGLTFFFINVECFSITFADYGHRKS
jgi:hypothetical protein